MLLGAGWSVVATDVSNDQLELAREVAVDAELVRADAHDLPFEDGRFDAVISLLTHTDFDDLDVAFSEAARVIRPGGRFVYAGPHPCFGSPMVVRGAAADLDDAVAIIRPGYPEPGWRVLPFDADSSAIRSRVGINHVPLGALVNALIRSGLEITRLEEPGGDDPPIFIAVSAVRAA